MTNLISQLFDIATNEEFSPEQRKELLEIVMDRFELIPLVDGDRIVGHLKRDADGNLVTQMFKGDTPPPSPASLNIDAALGKHLTKETLPNGGIRFGLRQDTE